MKEHVTFTKSPIKELSIFLIVAELMFAIVTFKDIFDMFNIVSKHIENSGIIEFSASILKYQNLMYHALYFFPSLFFVFAKACQLGSVLLFILSFLMLAVRISNIFVLIKKQKISYYISAFLFFVDSVCLVHKIIYACSNYSVKPEQLRLYESIPVNILVLLAYMFCFIISIVLIRKNNQVTVSVKTSPEKE